MKKYFVLGVFLSLLLPTISVSATAVLHRDEKSEGVLQLALKSDDTGYVTAFQVSLKIEGNASARLFEWSDSIKSNYTRKVVYNEKDATLDIIVATGNDDNLITKDGTIELGTLKFYENTSSNPRYYNIHFNKDKENYIQFMNRSYNTTIPSEVELNDEKTFTLQAKKTENPKEESDPSQGDDTTIYDPKDNQTSTKDPVKEDTSNEDKKDDNKEYFGKDDSKETSKPVKEDATPIYYYLLPIGGTIIVLSIAFLVWKRKK